MTSVSNSTPDAAQVQNAKKIMDAGAAVSEVVVISIGPNECIVPGKPLPKAPREPPVLLWHSGVIARDNMTTLPMFGTALSDVLVGLLISANVSVRDRFHYAGTFAKSGDLLMGRLDIGPGFTRLSDKDSRQQEMLLLTGLQSQIAQPGTPVRETWSNRVKEVIAPVDRWG